VEHKCRQTSLRENCLTIGMGAQMVTDTGLGRAISKEEMLELLETADKEGLVLQPENTKNPIFVCCCCGCCCAVLTSAKRFPRPADYFNAGFEAIADAETCEVCGVCETRCQMEAISMASGKASVDAARCIGCALCITTCPSGALRLEARPERATPPDDRKALYMQILQDRYGPWGMAKIGARKLLGMKI
jgi:ferredoxin